VPRARGTALVREPAARLRNDPRDRIYGMNRQPEMRYYTARSSMLVPCPIKDLSLMNCTIG